MQLNRRLKDPGFVVSALVHVGALAATLVAFSHTEKFDDLQETVPVEVVTDNQFNQVMKGDKAAKEVRPDATNKTEQAAAAAAEERPPPPPAQPPPPTPPVRPVQPAKPPPPVAVLPPPRPQPPAPPPPVPMPPVRVAEAEPVLPKPVPKPPPPKPVPTPPVVPHPVAAQPAPKPRPVEKPKVDQLAKLMADTAADTPPAPQPKQPKPTTEGFHFDLTDITKLLNTNAPSQKASVSQAAVHASLGSPTASAQKMSPSFWAGLDGLMEDQYRQCWSYLGLATGAKYVPQVRVVYASNGALQGEPVLINPPHDAELQNLADSALRAVRRCNPLKIPDQYAPYYDQWKGRVLRFDPEEMAG